MLFRTLTAISFLTALVGTASHALGSELIAHEWGTFVSIQGSDGVALDGVQHETEALPAFVYSATRETQSPFEDFGDTTKNVAVRQVNGKGETPVIYFYSPVARRVSVHVDFPGGLLTQWYPAVSRASPQITAAKDSIVDLSRIGTTFLEWELELVPAKADLPLPAVDATDPWAVARVNRAAYVRAGQETERYVFYRGLGRLQLPLSARGRAGDLLCVTNHAKHDVPAAFLIEMGTENGRYQPMGVLSGNEISRTSLTSEPKKKRDVIKQLERDVTRALIAQGLYEDEAKAMVSTWSDAWFASEGRRVLYLIPRAVTDEILPLTISPQPDQLVRVLVGRLEYMTDADEALVQTELKNRNTNDVAARNAAMRRLASLGRFLEPAVRRAVQLTADPDIRRSGQEILAAFR